MFDTATDPNPEPSLLPRGIPQEVLEAVMSHAADSDILNFMQVNSKFYLAAKPRLFSTLYLDSDFNVVGPGHPFAEVYAASGRPIFLREWALRYTSELNVPKHDSTTCAEFPTTFKALRTLFLPYDTHHSLRTNTPLADCGLHAMRVTEIVHKDFRFHDRLGTTSIFPEFSIERYTCILSITDIAENMMNIWSNPLHSSLAHDVVVTYVYPIVPPCPAGHAPKPLDAASANLGFQWHNYHIAIGCPTVTGCIHALYYNASWATLTYWSHMGHGHDMPKIIFVGLDEITSATTFSVGHSQSHVAFLSRCICQGMISEDSSGIDLSELQMEDLEAHLPWDGPSSFTIITYLDWLRSGAGGASLTPYECLKVLTRAAKMESKEDEPWPLQRVVGSNADWSSIEDEDESCDDDDGGDGDDGTNTSPATNNTLSTNAHTGNDHSAAKSPAVNATAAVSAEMVADVSHRGGALSTQVAGDEVVWQIKNLTLAAEAKAWVCSVFERKTTTPLRPASLCTMPLSIMPIIARSLHAPTRPSTIGNMFSGELALNLVVDIPSPLDKWTARHLTPEAHVAAIFTEWRQCIDCTPHTLYHAGIKVALQYERMAKHHAELSSYRCVILPVQNHFGHAFHIFIQPSFEGCTTPRWHSMPKTL